MERSYIHIYFRFYLHCCCISTFRKTVACQRARVSAAAVCSLNSSFVECTEELATFGAWRFTFCWPPWPSSSSPLTLYIHAFLPFLCSLFHFRVTSTHFIRLNFFVCGCASLRHHILNWCNCDFFWSARFGRAVEESQEWETQCADNY